MRNKIVILCIIGAVAGVILLFAFMSEQSEQFQLVPQKVRGEIAQTNEILGTEVGTGWSTNENPLQAVKEAISMALQGKAQKKPDFIVMYPSAGSDTPAILSATKELLGADVKIFGGTSDSRAVMTDKGFIKVTKRGYEQATMEGQKGLAIMTVTSKDIVFGVGSANLSEFTSPQEMSKAAVVRAIQNAGKTEDEPPRIVLILLTLGIEDAALEGIEEVLGRNVPVLGGTAGGPSGAAFGNNKVYHEGVSSAVIYTDLPLGWTYEGGFDVTDKHAGIVTKTQGPDIVEIDNRPALDVYDEWLAGEIKRLHNQHEEPDVIRDLLTLHPLYRRYTSTTGQDYFLFSHPWPKDSEMKDRCVSTSTKIKAGEKIYLSHGNWETFINRI